MEIKKFEIGILSTNCYIVYENNIGYIIDLGSKNLEKIFKFLDENKIIPKGVIFTHGHFDHIEGLDTLINKYPNIDIYIGEKDKEALFDPYKNLSSAFENDFLSFKVKDEKLHLLKGKDKIWHFKVYETPGHTPGSISLYNEEQNIIFSGDLIFYESYGRTDFPGGDFITLIDSIKEIINLNENALIYPGHYKETTVKEFKAWFEKNLLGVI